MNRNYNARYFTERDHLDYAIASGFVSLLKKHRFTKVLDIGCGTGRLVEYLRLLKYDAYGCDVSEKALQLARKINPTRRILKAHATKLPFPEKSFSAISAISLIEHLTPLEANQFLQEVKRVLKPHGHVFLVTPNFASPWRILQKKEWFGYKDPTHITFYTKNELAKLLKQQGFIICKMKFTVSYEQVGKQLHEQYPIPNPLLNFLTYLFYSSIFSALRNSFWIAAHT